MLACLCQLAGGGSLPSLTISLPNPVLEWMNLVITCIRSEGGAGSVVLLRNGQISGVDGVVLQSNTSVRVFDLGAVDRSTSGTVFQCTRTNADSRSAEVTLDVQC